MSGWNAKTYGQVPDRESEPLFGEPLMGNLSCFFKVARSSPARFSKSMSSSTWTMVVSIVSCSSPVSHLMAVALFLALLHWHANDWCHTWVQIQCCCLLHRTWAGSCLRVSVLWLSLPPSPQGICTLSNSLVTSSAPAPPLRGQLLGHHHRVVPDKRSMLQWPGAQMRLLPNHSHQPSSRHLSQGPAGARQSLAQLVQNWHQQVPCDLFLWNELKSSGARHRSGW